MRAVTKAAGKVLDKLTAGMTEMGAHRKLVAKGGPDSGLMPLVVERLGTHAFGDVFSVAHYFEQNGDLMADPEMTFLHAKSDGGWYPLSWKMDTLGLYQEGAELGPTDVKLRPRWNADHAVFAGTWMRNVAGTFDLDNLARPADEGSECDA